MGGPKPGHVTVTAGAPKKRRDTFQWYELKLEAAGAVGAGVSATHAERVFFLPDMDATIPIAEGPSPADWKGYHTGKHGVYERFSNLKGESVTLGQLFFNEKYRLQLIGEVFNLFNIANLVNVNDLVLPIEGTPNNEVTTLRPTQRSTSVFGTGGPRAFQFGAKFVF